LSGKRVLVWSPSDFVRQCCCIQNLMLLVFPSLFLCLKKKKFAFLNIGSIILI
jgi:hypothetical protein